MNIPPAALLALAATLMHGGRNVSVANVSSGDSPVATPSDPQLAAKYREERRQRKLAEFAKRTPKERGE